MCAKIKGEDRIESNSNASYQATDFTNELRLGRPHFAFRIQNVGTGFSGYPRADKMEKEKMLINFSVEASVLAR